MAKKKTPKKIIKLALKYIESLRVDKIVVKEAYLFGSYAKGTYKKDSDIDVCVISPGFKDLLEATTYLTNKSNETEEFSNIEGHGFTPKYFSSKFASLPFEIKRTGIKIA